MHVQATSIRPVMPASIGPLGGSLAEGFGLPLTVGLSGGITCLAAIWFYFRLPAVRAVARPVLQERGMIPRPEVSQGQ